MPPLSPAAQGARRVRPGRSAAGFTVSVEVRGVREAVRQFQKLSDEVRRGVRIATRRSALAVERGAKRRCPVDTGRLRSSIQTAFLRDGLRAEVGSRTGYGRYVEEGTRPHWPPVAALRPWARRVLKDPGLAFVVARRISRRGTKAQPFMLPAWQEERPRYLESIDKEIQNAARRTAAGRRKP